jgi:hypothetical protein
MFAPQPHSDRQIHRTNIFPLEISPQKEAYINMAKGWLPTMMAAVVETSEDGWKPCGMSDPTISNGVTLCKKVTEGNPVVMIRGVSEEV